VSYVPSRYDVIDGLAVFRAPWLVASKRFNDKFRRVQLPTEIRPNHPWAKARESNEICEGEGELVCDGQHIRFDWQAWWNNHALLVLLRRRPSLAFVRRILNS